MASHAPKAIPWIALILAAAAFSTMSPQTEEAGSGAAAKNAKKPCREYAASLESQLRARDVYIATLERQIDVLDVKVRNLETQIEANVESIAQANKLGDFYKNLSEFQEEQLTKMREVVREQRQQLNQLTDLLGANSQ